MSSSRPESWLSQANHIFSCLRISANFQDYGASETILGPLSSLTHHSCLGGGLVSARNSSSYSNPSPWFPISLPIRTFSKGAGNIHMARLSSLDPSGVERLSMEDAINLGFPSIQFSISVGGRSWDASVYAGLNQFHQAKGFDPNSQEVARNLGHPLYQPTAERDAP
jgi:hypothetical protein